MADQTKLLLGVDGGGSKTSVWLGSVNSDETSTLSVLGTATGGPSNVRALGFELALNSVKCTIEAAFAAAGILPAKVSHACISLAGAGRAEERAHIVQWAHTHSIAEKTRVVGDAEVVLEAAIPGSQLGSKTAGISLISGTGSMAWGRNAAGEQVRCGGWGYLFGDEGSAYDIGRQALQLACRSADGRASAAPFCHLLLEHLSLDSCERLIAWCYASNNARQQIASLAPFVFSVSQQDEFARQILDRSAKALAVLVKTVAHKLRFPSGGYLLGCAGSVLVKQPSYVVTVLAELENLGLTAAEHRLIRDPVAGALRIAAGDASS